MWQKDNEEEGREKERSMKKPKNKAYNIFMCSTRIPWIIYLWLVIRTRVVVMATICGHAQKTLKSILRNHVYSMCKNYTMIHLSQLPCL